MFFSRSNTIGHISGMVGPMDVKRKGGALVGYWVNYVTLIFDLSCDLDLWFFKVIFQISCISGIVIWLMWNKKKANQLDTGLTVWSCPWPHPWPWPSSFSRSKFEIALFEADWHGTPKGCESIIHDHDRKVWVTMVRWVNAPCCDWGDFRHRHTINISI